MRRLVQYSRLRGQLFARPSSQHEWQSFSFLSRHTDLPTSPATPARSFAKVRDHRDCAAELWFSSSSQLASPDAAGKDHEPVDERKLKLGKTIRILHDRLPSLLASPLPQEILSPQITLSLFPSTHPHLPSVTGRIAYTAALWTSPVAWGRMPVVGNVKLVILSERMMRGGGNYGHAPAESTGYERLIVRWKTCMKSKGDVTEQIKKVISSLGRDESKEGDQDFHGLFIFEFDEEGRIARHTIEHLEEGNNWEKTAKFISVTDWLLGKAWGKKDEAVPGLAICEMEDARHSGGTRS